MGECWHEKDGGVGEEGLEDPGVPAGDEAKEEAGEEHCCKDYCKQFNSGVGFEFPSFKS